MRPGPLSAWPITRPTPPPRVRGAALGLRRSGGARPAAHRAWGSREEEARRDQRLDAVQPELPRHPLAYCRDGLGADPVPGAQAPAVHVGSSFRDRAGIPAIPSPDPPWLRRSRPRRSSWMAGPWARPPSGCSRAAACRWCSSSSGSSVTSSAPPTAGAGSSALRRSRGRSTSHSPSARSSSYSSANAAAASPASVSPVGSLRPAGGLLRRPRQRC